MDVVKFKECNITFAENQPEYLPLPAHKTVDGIVTSCWRLDLFERLKVALTGKIYLQMLTFNRPLQPSRMSVNKALHQTADSQRQGA